MSDFLKKYSSTLSEQKLKVSESLNDELRKKITELTEKFPSFNSILFLGKELETLILKTFNSGKGVEYLPNLDEFKRWKVGMIRPSNQESLIFLDELFDLCGYEFPYYMYERYYSGDVNDIKAMKDNFQSRVRFKSNILTPLARTLISFQSLFLTPRVLKEEYLATARHYNLETISKKGELSPPEVVRDFNVFLDQMMDLRKKYMKNTNLNRLFLIHIYKDYLNKIYHSSSISTSYIVFSVKERDGLLYIHHNTSDLIIPLSFLSVIKTTKVHIRMRKEGDVYHNGNLVENITDEVILSPDSDMSIWDGRTSLTKDMDIYLQFDVTQYSI